MIYSIYKKCLRLQTNGTFFFFLLRLNIQHIVFSCKYLCNSFICHQMLHYTPTHCTEAANPTILAYYHFYNQHPNSY